jgi:hypothetical protein
MDESEWKDENEPTDEQLAPIDELEAADEDEGLGDGARTFAAACVINQS